MCNAVTFLVHREKAVGQLLYSSGTVFCAPSRTPCSSLELGVRPRKDGHDDDQKEQEDERTDDDEHIRKGAHGCIHYLRPL